MVRNGMIFNKILVVGPSMKGKGGIASVIQSYSKIYDNFHFVSTNSSKEKFKLCRNILIFLKAIVLIAYFKWIGRVEIMHVHGASKVSFERKSMLIKIALMFRYKIVYHSHGADFEAYAQKKGIDKVGEILNRCSAVVVLSKTWKKYFEETYGLKNVYIINNIVEPRTLEPEKNSDKLMSLLFLGQIGDRKGIFDLLDVIAANRADFDGRIKLTVGGDGDIERFNEMVSTNSLENIVDYVGWITGDDKKRLLSKCDVVVLPSYNEGLPIFILEAMAYSKPIISTTVGGIPEIVTTGHNGYLFSPGDKDALYDAIMRYYNNRDLLLIEGRNGADVVKAFYPEEVKAQLLKLYKELLSA